MATHNPKLHTRKKLISKKRMFSFTRLGILLMTAVLVFMPFTTAKAAVLDVEILTNITSTNTSGTTSESPYPGSTTQNVDFTIQGDAPVSASVLTGTRYAVLTIPAELQGQVTPSDASVTTNVTLDLNQVGLLSTVFDTTDSLVTTLTDILNGLLGSLTGVYLDTTQLYHDLDLLKGVQDIGGATYTAATTLNPDGTMVEANLDQGLGPILTQNLIDILQDLETAINNLNATATDPLGNFLAFSINATLEPLKAAATAAIDGLLTPLLGGTDPTGVVDTLTQQLLTASVLGDTTVKIPTTIDIPATSTGVVDSKFVGTVVQTDLLDVDLLITANGVSDVFWAGQAPADTTAPAAPVITSTTGDSTTGYTVTGTAEPNSTVKIYDADDAVVGTATTDADGNFTATLPASVGANAPLTATATDAAGNESPGTPFTTPADPDTTAPAAPVITSTTGNSTTGYTVTGTAEPNSTVKIYDADDAVVGTATTDADGNFTATLPASVGANAPLTATATDAAGNESPETSFTTPADPDTTAGNSTLGGGGSGGGSGTAYTVTFDLCNGGTTADKTVEIVYSGQKITSVPSVTNKKGYTFKGWSQDDPSKTEEPKLVDPKTVTIKEDTTFYAVYDGPMTGEHEHYIKGYDTGIFGPADNITRAQVAAIIARACLEGFHEDTDYGNSGYTDVADDHWARSAIAFVTMAGVFEGDGEGHFDPDRPITRQEFALVFARMAGLLNVGEMPFSDAGTTADWAISGVYTAYANGWLDGYNDGTFKPWNNITRSEAVKIVNRYLNRGVDATGIVDVYSELKQWPDVPSTYWAYYEILEASNDHTYFYADGEQPPEVYTKAYIEEASWNK